MGVRRVDFDWMARLGWVHSPQSIEARFGTSRAGAVDIALYTTASVDVLPAAHPEVGASAAHSTSGSKGSRAMTSSSRSSEGSRAGVATASGGAGVQRDLFPGPLQPGDDVAGRPCRPATSPPGDKGRWVPPVGAAAARRPGGAGAAQACACARPCPCERRGDEGGVRSGRPFQITPWASIASATRSKPAMFAPVT